MKKFFSKVLTVVLSVSLLATTMSFGAVFAADDSGEYLAIDVSAKKSITESHSKLSADTKIVKEGSKYSAKWKTSDTTILSLKTPKDLTPYTEIAFSVYSETDCTVHIRINSENSSTEGTDYYGKMYTLKAGWQDFSINIGKDLTKNRTPRGYNDVDNLMFSAQGWGQTNDYETMVLYFDNVRLINNPDYAKLSASEGNGSQSTTTEPTAPAGTEKIGDKIIYNNSFDAEGAVLEDIITSVPKTNKIELAKDGDNTYIRFETLTADNYYVEKSFKTDSTWLVAEFDLRTDTGFTGNLQYKDATSARGTGIVLTVEGYEITHNKETIGKLKKGEWANIKIVFDVLNLKETIYLNDKVILENKAYSTGALSGIQLLRMYIAGNLAAGTDVKFDNYKIYEGNALRDIGDEQPAEASGTQTGSDASPYKAVVGKDVEAVLPELSQVGSGVALMIDTPSAYAKGALTKVDTTNDAVVPVIVDSRTLVPVRFISESFDAQVAWDDAARKVTVVLGDKTIELTIDSNIMKVNGAEQVIDVPAAIMESRTMLPLRALVEALGKNVLWDTRGLIVITDSGVTLDAQKDVKLSTMLIGYLKTGVLANNYAAYPIFTQSVIDYACAAAPGHWANGSGNSRAGENGSKALYYLGLIVRVNPEAKASDGTLCKDAALKQLRSMITGGHEPFACVGPYWSHAIFAADLVLVKNTPVLYNELTAEEKDRMDWLMRALAVSGNWGYNDKNFYKTGVDLLGNFGKDYNPNYRNTYGSIMVSAIMYFGGDVLDSYLVNFSYDEYMAKFEEYGFVNIIDRWEAAGKELMENGGACKLVGGVDDRFSAGQDGGYGVGVKVPFVYKGMSTDDPLGIFTHLFDYTYAWNVISGYGTPGEKDHAYILSGATSPYEGQMGMFREFAGGDSGGKRSRCGYSYDSFMILTAVYSNMKLFGGWDSSTQRMRELDNRAYVGNEDLIFKLREGYLGHSIGTSSEEHESSYVLRGYSMDKDIWKNFLDMGNYQVEIATKVDSAIANLEKIPAAEPKNGVTSAPDGAYASTAYSNGVAASDYYALDKAYKKAIVEFDAVIGSEATDSEYNNVIIFDTNKDNGVWSNFNMLIQFTKGTINVMNGKGYTNSTVRFGANYRFHFKVEFDIAAKKYSVWVTQIYPTAGEVVQLADNFDFRASAGEIEAVDYFAIANNYAVTGMDMWLENFTIAGE